MIRNEMTRGRFVVLIGAVAVLCLIVYAWRGLIQSSELTAMIALIVAYAGLVPFLLGFVVQLIFLNRIIRSYVAWALAVVVVLIQWMLSGKAPFMVMEKVPISLMVSLIISGVFASFGLKASRALFKTKDK